MHRLLRLLVRMVVTNLALLVFVVWLSSQALTLDATFDMPSGHRFFLFIDKCGWALDGHRSPAATWDATGEVNIQHQYQGLLNSRDEYSYWQYSACGIRYGINPEVAVVANWSVGVRHWLLLLCAAIAVAWLRKSRSRD